jgi:putative ABC transport system permease protein
MNLQVTLALRYLAGRKLRTALTTTAIVFGVTLIFGMNLVLPTMLAALQANVQGAEGRVDFSVVNVSGESFPQAVTAKLQNLDGVRAASGVLQRVLNLPADFVDADAARPDRVSVLTLTGVVPEQARALRAYPISAGRYLQDSDGASAVISQTLADAFSVKVGGLIHLPSARGLISLTVVGILPGRLTSRNEEVLVNLAQAQLMTDEPGNINLIELNIEPLTGQARRAEIQGSIEAALGSHYRVGSLLAGDELFAAFQLGQISFSLFGVLALFMGGFIIFNTFRTVVSERRQDIGMLRALGATRRVVLGIILAEGLIQGLSGSLIGLGLGYLLAFGTLRLVQVPMSQFINIQLGLPVISAQLLLVSVLLGVGVTVLAGLLPAFRAGRVTPLDALRPALADVEYRHGVSWGFMIGAALVVTTLAAIFSGQPALIIPGGFLFLLGLVLLTPALVRPLANVFGRLILQIYARQGIGALAQNNLTRQSSRVALTVSASMLGLAVIVAAGGLLTSMSGTINAIVRTSLGRSDYLFVPPSIGIWGSNVGANASFAQALRQLPEVKAVSTFRFAASQSAGQAVSLLGIEPADFQQVSGLSFMGGGESAYAAIGSERALIANGAFLAATGKRVGQSVDLLTAGGVVRYRIAASGTDLLNGKITTAYISQTNLQTDFGSTEDVFVQLSLKEGVDRAAATARLLGVARDYPQFTLVSGLDYYNSIQAQMDAAYIALDVLFFILALPALIAMLNTLAIAVIERTREIGVLRALGGTQKQVRRMVLAEALLLAAIGTAFGLLGGLYLGYVFVLAIGSIFPMSYFFPLDGVLAAVAIGLLFGALAAFIPARQAARMSVVDALRYE